MSYCNVWTSPAPGFGAFRTKTTQDLYTEGKDMLDAAVEEDIKRVVAIAAEHAGDVEALKKSMAAACRVFYLQGCRDGYREGHADAENGVDQRTTAHLN